MTKIAVIGPSGAGKTFIFRHLPDLVADMDRGLGTDPAPPLLTMLNWILASEFPTVLVSVHIARLQEMGAHRERGTESLLSRLRFDYLFCEKSELERRLRKQLLRSAIPAPSRGR